MDDLVGTDLGTDAAAGTDVGVDLGDAVLDADGAVGTDVHAVPVAQAAVDTFAFAAVELLGALAAVDALIDVFLMGVVAVAAAADYGGHGQDFFRFHAHDGSDGFGSGIRTRNTKIGLGTGLYHGFGIAVTTGITTGAAVGSGQTFSHGRDTGIYLDLHDNGGYSQQQAAGEADDDDCQDGN